MRVQRKIFRKQFCLIRCRRQHLWPVEERRYSRFTFVKNTISNLPEAMRAKFLGSNGLFCFTSISKFGSFKNPFATITSLSELYFRFRRCILLVQTKIMIFVNYGSSTNCWKPWRWVRLDLILTMRDKCINSNLNPLTNFTGRSRSTEFKDILSCNISQMITKTVTVSITIVAWILRFFSFSLLPNWSSAIWSLLLGVHVMYSTSWAPLLSETLSQP